MHIMEVMNAKTMDARPPGGGGGGGGGLSPPPSSTSSGVSRSSSSSDHDHASNGTNGTNANTGCLKSALNKSASTENHHHLQHTVNNRFNAGASPHSASPGSTSGRSSTSSLNTLGTAGSSSLRQNGATTSSSSQIPGPPSSSSSKKVSINEHPDTVMIQHRPKELLHKLAASTTNISASAATPGGNLTSANAHAHHRTSLLHISSEKRARKVRFFINNDKFFKGAVIAVSGEKFRTFDKLLEHLTRIMCNQVTLPNGVRYIFGLDGKLIEDVGELSHEGNYVCASQGPGAFRKLDYLKVAQEQDQLQWNRIKRETYYLGLGSGLNSKIPTSGGGTLKRDAYKQSGHSKSFGQTATAAAAASASSAAESRFQLKPKIIAVLRSGMRPRKAVRVLLNHRNTKSFDTILGDLTNLVKLDSGAVRKVFTLNGKAVLDVVDFSEEEVFIAYGSDKCQQEDFDLDMIEFRNVQAILKSPDLDAKYEKYSSASPKTSRRKFLNSRQPANRTKARKASASKTRGESPRVGPNAVLAPVSGSGNNAVAGGVTNGNHGDAPSHAVAPGMAGSTNPLAITHKYVVGDIIGDGNFAIVRKCFSKKTKREYALKIIDKAKCQGKEYMIESEISILGQVSHPHIIELIEVFDFADEKYLVTEYVRGGDLFDAIAADTKYSEPVSRLMVADLTAALKYLHDKMIVHRDIKPENLLVVDLPKQGLKSLKLGDFGLAQVVNEPLFTVCGTPTYVAPEILAETGYGVKVDVWATGVIMYILLVGFPPFSSRTNNQEELFDQILSGLFEFNSPDWDDISYPAKELISWMLQVDPLQRYSAYEILQHPWIGANSAASPAPSMAEK